MFCGQAVKTICILVHVSRIQSIIGSTKPKLKLITKIYIWRFKKEKNLKKFLSYYFLLIIVNHSSGRGVLKKNVFLVYLLFFSDIETRFFFGFQVSGLGMVPEPDTRTFKT
jgi:hypothetical protein